MKVDLVKLSNTCQVCNKNKGHSREIFSKDYMGPCGDSFCFASCDSVKCRPVRIVVCDKCKKEHAR